MISTGWYYIHINSDDEEDNQKPNVSGDARRAQEEANQDAAAQEDDDEAEVPGEEDDMDTQGCTSGYSEEDDSGWYYQDTDLASRDIINSQRMAICLDELREAQYMAGFIALQMSKMWGMFEGGEERTMNAGLEGRPGCPYHNNFKRYPNITEHDQEGILLPSTALKISQSENFRTRVFRSDRCVCRVYSYDGVQMRGTIYILQAVDCSENPRCRQGGNEAPGQGPCAPGG